MTPPAALTAEQARILHRYGAGEDIAHIAQATNIKRDTVSAAVERVGFDRGRARALAATWAAANPGQLVPPSLAPRGGLTTSQVAGAIRQELAPVLTKLNEIADALADRVAASGPPGLVLGGIQAIQSHLLELAELLPEAGALTGGPTEELADVDQYDALWCPACGSRYRVPVPDHGCGALIPVSVRITRRAGP